MMDKIENEPVSEEDLLEIADEYIPEMVIPEVIKGLIDWYGHTESAAQDLVDTFFATFANENWCQDNEAPFFNKLHIIHLHGGLCEDIHYYCFWKGEPSREALIKWRKACRKSDKDLDPKTLTSEQRVNKS